MTDQHATPSNSHAKWLRMAADELDDRHHTSYANTCNAAADEIDRLTRELASAERALAEVREGVVKARLSIMGHIEVMEPEGDTVVYPMALLISFTDAESIRKAIADGKCAFEFAPPSAEQEKAG